MKGMFLSDDGDIWKVVLAISAVILIVLKLCLLSRFHEHVIMSTILNAGLKKMLHLFKHVHCQLGRIPFTKTQLNGLERTLYLSMISTPPVYHFLVKRN